MNVVQDGHGLGRSFFINYLESVLGRIPPKLVVSLDGCQCCSAYLFTAL